MGTASRHVLTNVRLSLATLKSLKHRAVEERRPAAALVLEAIQEYLIRKPGQPEPAAARRWLLGLAGLAKSVPDIPTDLADEHDHYLYGSPRRSRKNDPDR